MVGELWGPHRSIGPEPEEHGCIWDTKVEDHDREKAWERRQGSSKKLKRRRAEANSRQRELRKEAEDARKEKIASQVWFSCYFEAT